MSWYEILALIASGITGLILLGTAGVVAWYAWETRKMREEMVRQTEQMMHQTELSQSPFIIAWSRELLIVFVSNVGNGPAIDCKILPLKFNESIGEITETPQDYVLKIPDDMSVVLGNEPVQIAPSLLQQSKGGRPIRLGLRVPEPRTDDKVEFLKGINAIWIMYQDIIGRRFSKMILLDEYRDYLRQEDYKGPLPPT